jgi:hypothetical protein
MKKIYYIVVAICLANLSLAAQPVITYSGNAPQIGENYHYAGDLASYDPGPSGANQTWDFSNITSAFTSSPRAVSPGSTPYTGEFTEATIAFAQTEANDSYIFSQVTTSEFLNVGIGNHPEGGSELIIHYTDAVKLLKYPFSFSESYTDNYYASYSMVEGMTTHERGTAIVTADAWGSVTTPTGTYNTLRIKRERTFTDSVWVSGVFISATTRTQTDYEWYTSTSHTPVVTISVTGDGTTATYRTDYISGVEKQQLPSVQVSIFPNPASEYLTIRAEKKIKNIRLLSANGRQLNEIFLTTPNYQQTVEFSMYPKGVYFIKLEFDKGVTITKKIIK